MNIIRTPHTPDIKNAQNPAWERAKHFKRAYGISASQLERYSRDGLIRTTSIKRPGQTRGVRLYSLADMKALIQSGMEGGSN